MPGDNDMGLRLSFKGVSHQCQLGLATTALALLVLGTNASQAADIAKGEAAFVRQCAICHTIDKGGENRLGPNLFGIVGRRAGTVPGFKYTNAFRTIATFEWTEGLLGSWIALPSVMVPGTAMGAFPGVSDRDKGDIVAYLAAQK
jgi:cytochrome c